MKDIRPALHALLASSPTVASLVGSPRRIFPVLLPQGERRASVVYNRITGIFQHQMSGSADLLQNIVQFDSVSELPDDADLLARAVHDVLNGARGEVFYGSASPQESVVIRGIFGTNVRDLYDSVTKLHRMARDFSVWYKET